MKRQRTVISFESGYPKIYREDVEDNDRDPKRPPYRPPNPSGKDFWTCRRCEYKNLAWRKVCFKCGEKLTHAHTQVRNTYGDYKRGQQAPKHSNSARADHLEEKARKMTEKADSLRGQAGLLPLAPQKRPGNPIIDETTEEVNAGIEDKFAALKTSVLKMIGAEPKDGESAETTELRAKCLTEEKMDDSDTHSSRLTSVE